VLTTLPANQDCRIAWLTGPHIGLGETGSVDRVLTALFGPVDFTEKQVDIRVVGHGWNDWCDAGS